MAGLEAAMAVGVATTGVIGAAGTGLATAATGALV